MLRLTFLLRRKEGMSRAEMQDYWLNVHGPLVVAHSAKEHVMVDHR